MEACTHPSRTLALSLVLLLVGTGLAGCLEGDQPGQEADLSYGSYAEAKAAPGPVYEPVNTDSPVRLKLLQPTDPMEIDDGGLDVLVFLYDSESDEPITDASFVIEARMPAMGHGTSPETDPIHQAHGVYAGETTISMPGDWLINLDPQLADGTVLEFDVEARAGGGSMEGNMDHGPDTSARYESYSAARDAEGDVLEPDDSTGERDIRLKLLDPASPSYDDHGKRALAILLYDAGTDEPVTDAPASMELWMPMMGHGSHGNEAPTHKGHGEHVGVLNLTMNGTWEVNLTATMGDGSEHTWRISFQVGEGSMQMDDS